MKYLLILIIAFNLQAQTRQEKIQRWQNLSDKRLIIKLLGWDEPNPQVLYKKVLNEEGDSLLRQMESKDQEAKDAIKDYNDKKQAKQQRKQAALQFVKNYDHDSASAQQKDTALKVLMLYLRDKID